MKKNNPPRWAVAFFRWFCNDHLSDGVMGDMLELYDRRRLKLGKFKADLIFVWNVIQFIQPFAVRSRRNSSPTNTFDMFSNYFKIAWRGMARQKLYTSITIGGFAIGVATCILIFLFIRSEMNHDQHYQDGSRLFRVYNDYTGPDGDKWTHLQTPLINVIKQELPDAEVVARLMPGGMGHGRNPLLRCEDAIENTFEERVAYADPELLPMLEIPMVFGNATKALEQPYSMVITRRKSIQYFGDADPIGKTMIFNEDRSHPYIIGGVMEDFRTDSHFQYDFLLTLKDFEFWPGEQTNWCCWNYNGYVKLHEGVNPLEFEKKLIPIRDTFVIGYMEQTGSKDIADFREHHSFRLQSLKDIWLQPEIGDPNKHGDMDYVWLFGGIAIFILVIACINFINLATARSANRAKEVGLRKVVGSLRRSLITQFLTESILNSVISFAIALLLTWLLLPAFGSMANRPLTMPWSTWWFLPSLISASLVIGLMAGVYPALYLSAHKPIDTLKGRLNLGARSGALRSGMVVFQFSASIMLIIGTLIIYRHMNFLMSKDVGFDKEQVMIIEGTNTFGDKKEVFRNELLKLSDVERVSISGYLPVEGANREGYAFFKEGKEKEDKMVSAQKWRVDADYIPTMKMKITQGRDFIRGMVTDSSSVIINEIMAQQLGLKDPVGQRITNGTVYTVIGVVADFNFSSMKEPVRPLCMVIEKWGDNATAVRLKSTDIAGSIQSVTKVWDNLMPNQPFRFSFLDEKFARMYDDVLRTGRIFAAFALLAVAIACLGLFALSAFMTEQRAKEISIRLVMGASVKSIFRLLTGNFMKLVVISWMVATPIAWYIMNQWLMNFTYREPISSDILILSGVVAASIALITVSYQSIKAALANPIKSLKND